MDASKKFLKDEGIVPFISFKDGSAHTVTLQSDKKDKIKDKQGKDQEGISYSVKEKGTKKKFFTSAISLISKLAEYEEGDIATIQMKKRKNEDGNFISYYEVTKGDTIDEVKAEADENESEEEDEIKDEDIPELG